MADEKKPAYHPVAWLGEPKQVQNPVEGLHIFDPDHNMYCNLCGYGELQGDHGMIPSDGGASGTDFSPMYENDQARKMYNEALRLSDFEESRPDWPLRAELDTQAKKERRTRDMNPVAVLSRLLEVFHHPAKFGCTWNLGDAETYQQRVGWILDDADAATEVKEVDGPSDLEEIA